MICIIPGGLIYFVSKPYRNRTSVKVIFEQSRLITKMSYPDAIMVDKRFLIDNIYNINNIKYYYNNIRPPFFKNKRQFSKEEALLTKDIAKARVHIGESIKE